MQLRFDMRWFLLLICTQAWADAPEEAQVSDLTQIPIEQLLGMQVQTASKIASQISVAPSAVSIVTAQDIKAYGYHTLAEILESMRGLHITNDHAYAFLGGRGYGRPGDFTGRIMVLLDGTQINNNIYNSAGLAYTGIVDVALIERVEYVSGPGATMYGNNAYFGIINIITKQGHSINGVQTSVEIASDQGREVKVHYGKRLENGADMLLSAAGFTSEGQNRYFEEANAGQGGVARGLDEQYSRHLFGKVEWDDWLAQFAYTARKKDIPTAPYGADFNAPYYYQDKTLEASLKHDRSLSKTLQLSLNAYYGNYNYQGLATYGTPWHERSIGYWYGVNAQMVGTWFSNQRIVLGAEFRNNAKQEISNPSVDINKHEKVLSVYAQDEITLSPQWKANIGTRIDADKGDSESVSYESSPRVALTYQPLDTTSFKLSWSKAFRRPNPFEEYYADGTLIANPDLKPEYVKATELVVDHHFDSTSRLLSSIYHYKTDDAIWSSPIGGGQSQFQNKASAHTSGIELEYEKHWDNNMRLRASVAYQDAQNSNGDWLPNSPRGMVKLNFAIPLNDTWSSAFEMQTYSDRKTERASMIGGYSVANLTINAEQLLPNLSLAFGIRNLFDRDYAHVAPSNNFQTTIPQDGRSYWLRMVYDFK